MRTLLASLLVVAAGCGAVSPHARATAGRIGCPAGAITISDREGEESGPRSWVASCGGRRYACSGSRDLAEPRSVVCTELGGGTPRTSRIGGG